MPTPPLSRATVRVGSPPTNEFNRPILTAVAMPVAVVQESSLPLLGGDSCFTRAMNFVLPSNLEELIGSILEDDLLDDGVEMICRGLILTRRGAKARRRRVSRLEHQLQAAELEKLCSQAAELELGASRVAELEKAEVERAVEVARLRKALEEAERKGASLEGEVVSLRQGKESVEAEVLKTMEDTMVLIIQSFNLAARQAGVLYGGASTFWSI